MSQLPRLFNLSKIITACNKNDIPSQSNFSASPRSKPTLSSFIANPYLTSRFQKTFSYNNKRSFSVVIPLPIVQSPVSQHKKYMHMSSSNNKEIGYKEFLELRKDGLIVIDVRESGEIKASGTIPGSLNIPSNQVESALKRLIDDFLSIYGRSKPNVNEKLMFLCQKGVRSKKAMEKAVLIGYKNAVSLKGGWEEFSKHTVNK